MMKTLDWLILMIVVWIVGMPFIFMGAEKDVPAFFCIFIGVMMVCLGMLIRTDYREKSEGMERGETIKRS